MTVSKFVTLIAANFQIDLLVAWFKNQNSGM
jgi:hypothetical protein